MGLLLLAFDVQKIDEIRKKKKYFELYLELAIERAPRRPHLTLLQLEHLHGELVASLACSTVNANYEGNLQARCGTKSAGATKLAFSKHRRNPEQIWTSRYFLDTSIFERLQCRDWLQATYYLILWLFAKPRIVLRFQENLHSWWPTDVPIEFHRISTAQVHDIWLYSFEPIIMCIYCALTRAHGT